MGDHAGRIRQGVSTCALTSLVGVERQTGSPALSWRLAVAAALLSLVIERFTYRYMKAKYGDATEHAIPLVSSLGFLIIFEHLVIGRWGSDSLTIVSPFGNASFHIGNIQFSVPQLTSLVLSLAIVFALSTMLKRTRLGRALRSIAERHPIPLPEWGWKCDGSYRSSTSSPGCCAH